MRNEFWWMFVDWFCFSWFLGTTKARRPKLCPKVVFARDQVWKKPKAGQSQDSSNGKLRNEIGSKLKRSLKVDFSRDQVWRQPEVVQPQGSLEIGSKKIVGDFFCKKIAVSTKLRIKGLLNLTFPRIWVLFFGLIT